MCIRALYIVVVAVAMASCVGVQVDFDIAPSAVPEPSQQSDLQAVMAVTETLAQRYALGVKPDLPPGYVVGYWSEALSLDVFQRSNGSLSVELVDAANSRWTAKGDSLRQALRDALSARFPSRIEER